MTKEGEDYETALKEAQAKGFAEPDPTADVEGIDTANKLCILMTLAMDHYVNPRTIPTTGITGVTPEDIEAAKERDSVIKLIAKAENVDGNITYEVKPTEIPMSHPLAEVSNEFNAIYLNGDAVGELMFYGKGAGALPTGSALVADILAIMKDIAK